jgi:hypothetical protein
MLTRVLLQYVNSVIQLAWRERDVFKKTTYNTLKRDGVFQYLCRVSYEVCTKLTRVHAQGELLTDTYRIDAKKQRSIISIVVVVVITVSFIPTLKNSEQSHKRERALVKGHQQCLNATATAYTEMFLLGSSRYNHPNQP